MVDGKPYGEWDGMPIDSSASPTREEWMKMVEAGIKEAMEKTGRPPEKTVSYQEFLRMKKEAKS